MFSIPCFYWPRTSVSRRRWRRGTGGRRVGPASAAGGASCRFRFRGSNILSELNGRPGLTLQSSTWFLNKKRNLSGFLNSNCGDQVLKRMHMVTLIEPGIAGKKLEQTSAGLATTNSGLACAKKPFLRTRTMDEQLLELSCYAHSFKRVYVLLKTNAQQSK